MALTQDVKTVRYGVGGNASQPVYIPAIGASTTVYGGSICITDSNGYIKNASSASSTDTCWGLVHAQTKNSSTAPVTTGQILDINGRPFQVDTGSFYVNAGTGGDALTEASLGKTVYVINETTVGATSSSNTRPVAGILIDIDLTQPGGYAVKFGSSQSTGAPQ
jgi:hypothetical protein